MSKLLVVLAGGALAALLAACATDDTKDFKTRTIEPVPSPALTKALGLDVAPWHRPGVQMQRVRLPPDVLRHSAEAALQALDALDPTAMQNDFDRAWVMFERGAALIDAGRFDDARATFEQVLEMPRTKAQDRRARMALHILGEHQYPGRCPPLQLAGSVPPPSYPRIAGRHAIEGWVNLWGDIEPGGKIVYSFVDSSSIRVFEQAALDRVMSLHAVPEDPTHPIDQPCLVRVRVHFLMLDGKPVFPIDRIQDDTAFTYRSIGAAIRVRVDAYNAMLGTHVQAP